MDYEYRTMNPTSEVLNRVIKYLVEGLFVAMAALFIPRHRLPMDEILTLGVVAAAMESQSMMNQMPEMREEPMEMEMMPPQEMMPPEQMMPPQGMPQ